MKEEIKTKLQALVIETTTKSWSIVNMTKLFEDGRWECGLNLITSIEDVIEQAEKENVPVITRQFMETKLKK